MLARMEEDEYEDRLDRREESSGSTRTEALPDIGEEMSHSDRQGIVGIAERIEEVNTKPFFVRY